MFDVRAMIELGVLLATPVFAAGGAWASVKLLREDVRALKADVRRVDRRVVNLYGHLRVPMPIEPEDSVS
ncbi:MAG: hypothetical protein ACREJ2_11665 [Planctomycetota bacterium]